MRHIGISWPTLAHRFDYCVHWVVWSYFQQFIVRVVSRSCQKGQISNFINVNRKGIYQMQFKLRIPMVPFILLCDVWDVLKFELYVFFHTPYTYTNFPFHQCPQKCAFLYIEGKFSIRIHPDGFYDILWILKKETFWFFCKICLYVISKYVNMWYLLKICQIVFFFKILKTRDSTYFGRHIIFTTFLAKKLAETNKLGPA